MAVHKYIFYIDDGGIRTYKFKNHSEYENFKYKGESICKEKDMKVFYQWFEKAASIAIDDGVDFCFLSERPIETLLFNYTAEKVSSWNQDDILQFCQSEIGEKNYEIVMDEERKFVCQISNVLDKNSVKKLYLKCFPEFEFKKKEITNDVSDEISLLSRYFREKLNEL